jgi:CheY-like chemotaxis protein
MGKNKKVVLLIDDNPLLNKLYSTELEKRGLEVIDVYSGKEALKAIEEHTPDMVVLDLFMPGIDGIEVLERIRSNPKTQDLKVIILTISDRAEDKSKAEKLGVYDYLIKSDLHISDIINKVLYCLNDKNNNNS